MNRGPPTSEDRASVRPPAFVGLAWRRWALASLSWPLVFLATDTASALSKVTYSTSKGVQGEYQILKLE